MITYSKGTQTMVSSSTSTDDVDSEASDNEAKLSKKADGGSGRETEEDMRKRILEELEVERKEVEKELRELKEREDTAIIGQLTTLSHKAWADSVKDLSNERRQAIFAAPDFSSFIEESTRIVQRALSDNYDYIRDYTIGIDATL